MEMSEVDSKENEDKTNCWGVRGEVAEGETDALHN